MENREGETGEEYRGESGWGRKKEKLKKGGGTQKLRDG